jgi:hypothetical protein
MTRATAHCWLCGRQLNPRTCWWMLAGPHGPDILAHHECAPELLDTLRRSLLMAERRTGTPTEILERMWRLSARGAPR